MNQIPTQSTQSSHHENVQIESYNYHYTPDIERVLEHIRLNSILLSKEHHKRYLYLNHSLKFYRIPIIVFSSCSSILSMSQEFIPQHIITILNTVFSFVCSVIGAIELFMQVSQQMVQEKSASIEYYILASDIYKCLGLKPENRTSDGKTFLEEKYGTYVKLIERSNIVRKNIKDVMCHIPEDVNTKFSSFSIAPELRSFRSTTSLRHHEPSENNPTQQYSINVRKRLTEGLPETKPKNEKTMELYPGDKDEQSPQFTNHDNEINLIHDHEYGQSHYLQQVPHENIHPWYMSTINFPTYTIPFINHTQTLSQTQVQANVQEPL